MESPQRKWLVEIQKILGEKIIINGTCLGYRRRNLQGTSSRLKPTQGSRLWRCSTVKKTAPIQRQSSDCTTLLPRSEQRNLWRKETWFKKTRGKLTIYRYELSARAAVHELSTLPTNAISELQL